MKLVSGWGINNANYTTQEKITISWENGIQKQKVIWLCPFYSRWEAMIKRAKKKYLIEVHEEWKYFLDFKDWMETQQWENLQLDKDILFPGNKIYSSSTCVFVPDYINSILGDALKSRGEYPIGVSYRKRPCDMVNEFSNPYQANISEKGKQKYLGVFPNANQAHRCWQHNKVLIIESAIESYKEEESYLIKVENALFKRFLKIKSDIASYRITEKL